MPDTSHATDRGLSLLGGWQLVVDGHDVALGGREQRLCALLALTGARARAQVAGTLWPESTDARALASLRRALAQTRDRCPGLVVADRTSVALAPDVVVDVDGLRTAAARAGTPDADAALLVTLAGDPLLPGWYDEWVEGQRDELERLRVDALEHLAHRALERGDTQLVEGAAREVEIDARGRRVRKPTPVAVEVRTTPETGCVAGDCTNGTGTFVYAGGNRYEGQWRDGNREGRGTGFFADGDRYEGEWRNNVFHGRGTYTWTTGVRFTGTYADGEEVDGTYTSSWGTSARIAGGELVEPPPDPAAAAGAGTQEGGAAAREYYLVYAVVPNTTREIAWVDIPTSYAIHCYSVDAPADMDRQSLMDRIRRQIAFTRMPQYGRRRVREFHGFQIDDRGRSCYEVARTESMRVGREVVGWYDAPPTISIDW